MDIHSWIQAARLRTLPLALSSILMGTFLAASKSGFSWFILVFAALTTVSLQILSNLANDYGDFKNGADSDDRVGPARMVQSERISIRAMLKAIYVFSFLSFLFGIILLFQLIGQGSFIVFMLLGLLSIGGAIFYTVGKNPYGYAGFGDLSVFIFFGWLGVLGTFYLHTGYIEYALFLPATSCSLFAVAVLNLNNLRDILGDAKAGKRSIPVRLGRQGGVIYHWFLLIIGLGCALLYTLLNYRAPVQWIFLLVVPLLFINGRAAYQKSNPKELDPYLKQMALTSLLFAVLFGVGLVW